MEERNPNSIDENKIYTLEEIMKQLGKLPLLKQLDESLEHVRRNKTTEKEHLDVLKSVDKVLRELSRFHHPDKAINEKKSEQELADAQNLQAALNATRTVLQALTKAFLNDIDIHYRYEFFSKTNISSLINEKEMDRQINRVLCKIGFLSEVKRVNIVGEIRKFLQESRESLRSFLDDDKDEFERHRDYAFWYFHKCIEGYEALVPECELTAEECESENDGNMREAIQKITDRSRKELNILQTLKIIAKRSLHGTFRVLSVDKTMEEYEYLVLPFVLYVDVLLMCSKMVEKKSWWIKFMTKIRETFEYWLGINTEEYVNFINEKALLEAYHLASYYNNKNNYKKEVKLIFKEKHSHTTESNNILEAFKESVKQIEQFLDKEFDINTYKVGKSNLEQFHERLFELCDSVAKFKEMGNYVIELIKLNDKKSNKIQKECLELTGENGETEEIRQEDNPPLKCVSGSETTNYSAQKTNEQYLDFSEENDENSKEDEEEITSFDREGTNKAQQNTQANNISPPYVSGNETTDNVTQKINEQGHGFSQENDANSKEDEKKITYFDKEGTNKAQQNTQTNNPPPECVSGNETTNNTT